VYTGDTAAVNFYLNTCTDLSSLITAIDNIRYIGGWTNTTGALRLTRTEIFNAANGDRPLASNVAILITDGVPTIDIVQLPDEVQKDRAAEIHIVGVGVTSQVSWNARQCTIYILYAITRKSTFEFVSIGSESGLFSLSNLSPYLQTGVFAFSVF
jgi:hypothetical protein